MNTSRRYLSDYSEYNTRLNGVRGYKKLNNKESIALCLFFVFWMVIVMINI